MTQTERVLTKAYAAALAGKTYTGSFEGVDPAGFFRLAVAQGVAGAVYYSVKGSAAPEKLKQALEDSHNKAILWDLSREEEEKRVFAALDTAEINYLPLKGSIMRMYYPSTDMRLMGDTDIMIDRYARRATKRAMEDCGYKKVDSHSGHDIYKHNNGNVFEVHWKPTDASTFHKKLMERALPVGEGTRLSLNLSDFYIYMINHLAHHVKLTGAGIRMLGDIKVFCARCNSKLDADYIRSVLEEMGLVRFDRQVKKLIHTLFYGAEADELTQDFGDYIISGGVFGSEEICNANRRGDKSKFGYFISSVLPSFGAMKLRYPFLKYLPFLLPIMWVVRWISLLFRGKKPAERYAKAAAVDKKLIKRNKRLLQGLELKTYKNGKRRMSAGDIVTALLLIAVLAFAVVFLGRMFFQKNEKTKNSAADNSVSDSALEESGEESGEPEETADHIPERHYGEIPFKEGVYIGYLNGENLPDFEGGKLLFNNGASYSGGFSDGEFNGYGKYQYPDGSYYDGMWQDGAMEGPGVKHFSDGTSIEGEFSGGEPIGECTFECANGDQYVGPIKNGKWHGKGKFISVNGDVYEGSFEMGVRQGYGKYLHCNGDSYEGYWINDVQNGYGTYTISGNTYKGIFVEGVMEGEGVAIFENGDTYKGYFVHDSACDDEAEYTFASGGSYKGSFENDCFHGKGTIIHTNGDTVTGNFVNGYLQGEASYYYSKESEWRTITYVDGKPQ